MAANFETNSAPAKKPIDVRARSMRVEIAEKLIDCFNVARLKPKAKETEKVSALKARPIRKASASIITPSKI